MLKAFDPDLLINYSSDPLPSELKVWEHRTFPADRLDWRPTNAIVYRHVYRGCSVNRTNRAVNFRFARQNEAAGAADAAA